MNASVRAVASVMLGREPVDSAGQGPVTGPGCLEIGSLETGESAEGSGFPKAWEPSLTWFLRR